MVARPVGNVLSRLFLNVPQERMVQSVVLEAAARGDREAVVESAAMEW